MLKIRLKKSLKEFSLDISFSVDQEILAIVGASGCGKTMTLKCIAGLFQPDEGSISLDEKLLYDAQAGINLPPRQREVGFVFQNYALFPHMSVIDNVAFGIRQLKKHDVKERVNLLLQKMRLEQFGQRYPGQLSGGQQQRVAIARALANEPRVLLLDEPFSALDSIVKESLQEELMELQNYFTGHVILVTHNLAEAYKMSSRIAVYEAGRIMQWDDKRIIIDQPANSNIARLTGVKNLFNAVIEEIGNKHTLVHIQGLEGLFRIDSKASARLSKGQQVCVGIRTEHVKLLAENGENTFPAAAVQMVDEISASVYHFRSSQQQGKHFEIEVKVPRQASIEINKSTCCYLHLPPENLFITSA